MDQDDIVRDIQSLSPHHFEVFIADLWARNHYRTTKTQTSSDGGVDVWATVEFPYNRRIAIQAKRYSPGNRVGVSTVRECGGIHRRHTVDEVVIATSSTFTRTANEEAKALNVKLVDGHTLAELVLRLNADDILQTLLDATASDTDSEQPVSDPPNPIVNPSRGDILTVLRDKANVAIQDGDIVHEERTVTDAYRTAVGVLIDEGYLTQEVLPIVGGRKRYVVASSPQHSDGSKMHNEGDKIRDGFYLDTNLNSEQKAQRLETLIEAIVTGDSDPTADDEEPVYRIIVDTDAERRAFESAVQTDAMEDFCRYLVHEELILNEFEMPYTPFGDRALLNTEPQHPDPDQPGKFRELKDGVYVHTKLGSSAKQKRIRHLAEVCDLGVQFEGDW